MDICCGIVRRCPRINALGTIWVEASWQGIDSFPHTMHLWLGHQTYLLTLLVAVLLLTPMSPLDDIELGRGYSRFVRA